MIKFLTVQFTNLVVVNIYKSDKSTLAPKLSQPFGRRRLAECLRQRLRRVASALADKLWPPVNDAALELCASAKATATRGMRTRSTWAQCQSSHFDFKL